MIDSALHFESTATKPSCENIKFSYMVMHILRGISYLFEMDHACSSINIIVTLVFNMDRLKFYYLLNLLKMAVKFWPDARLCLLLSCNFFFLFERNSFKL